jgi:FkbM family methyltransferase
MTRRARFKVAARAWLAGHGWEVRRIGHGLRRTLPEVLAYYSGRGLRPATVIDVGVGAGTPAVYAAFPEARLVLIEPLQEWTGALRAIARERPTDVILAAAAAHAGEISIGVHRVPYLSTTIGARPEDPGELQARTVPAVRIDDVVSERGLRGPFVVKIDVEGAELDVLAGAEELLGEAELVLLEASFVDLIPGAPQFAEVVDWMNRHDFVVADLYDGHNRPLDGALALMDVAFVKRDGRFRSASGYGTSAQNDALYRSWGF